MLGYGKDPPRKDSGKVQIKTAQTAEEGQRDSIVSDEVHGRDQMPIHVSYLRQERREICQP